MNLLKFLKSNKLIVESIIYITLLITITYLYLAGDIIFRFIPILFILGFIGNVMFKRPIVTALFSFVVSLLVGQILNHANIYNNFLNSGYLSILIILGECAGYFFITLKNNKEMSKLAYRMNFIYLIIITFSAILLNDHNNGNLYKYLEAKLTLNNYFKKEYNYTEDIVSKNEHYIRGEDSYYSFDIEIDNKTYEYLVDSNTYQIIDKNIDKFSLDKVNEFNLLLSESLKNGNIKLNEGYKIGFVNKSNSLKLNLKITYTTTAKENLNDFLINANNILNSVIQEDTINQINDLELKYTNKDTDLYAVIDNRYLLDINRYKEAFEVTALED